MFPVSRSNLGWVGWEWLWDGCAQLRSSQQDLGQNISHGGMCFHTRKQKIGTGSHTRSTLMSPSRDPPLPVKLHHLPDQHHKLGTKCSNPGREISYSSHSVPLARPYKQAYFPAVFVIVRDFWSPLKWNQDGWWFKCRDVTRTPQRHKLSSSIFTTNVLLVINYN